MVQTKALDSARGAGTMNQPPLDPKAFGARLVGSRLAAGLDRVELARRSGVSKRAIDGYEAGVRFPLSGIPALAEALGVDPHWLVFGTSWDVERLGELAAELRHQTAAFHDAVRFTDAQWEAFRTRYEALETRLRALEVLNERILMLLSRALGPMPPPEAEPPEPE